jgi:adenylate cyclase class 2
VGHDNVESELKIPVESHRAVRASLQELGAVITHPAAREENALFDAGGRLTDAGCVLRLRRYGNHHVLTFKGPARFDGPVKVRTEHELEIESTDAMRRVLEAVGFSVIIAYHKQRESWQLGDLSVVLDHTPMGDYVEVEGPESELERTARSLGLEPSCAVQGSYVSLWREYRARHPELDLPEDMVFVE